jgi:GNAT superfamily N-acetyltransferase
MIALGRFGLELRQPERPGLVLESWLRSYRRLYKVPGLSPLEWYAGQRAIATRLLPDVWAAYRPEAPNTIHGWACGEAGVLHYVYVPADLRGRGIGGELVRAVCGERGVITHQPPRTRALAGFVYNPFALFRALENAPCALAS